MSDIDLDAMVRDQQERPHLYGPGAVEDLRDRLAAEVRRLTESLDAEHADLWRECWGCDGAGMYAHDGDDHRCRTCDGRGYIERTDR